MHLFSKDEIAQYYAVRVPKLKHVQSSWRGPCPIHEGKGDNFAVDPKTGLWFCHSQCGRGGDIFQLEARLHGGDFRTAKGRVFALIGRTDTYAESGARRTGFRDEAEQHSG